MSDFLEELKKRMNFRHVNFSCCKECTHFEGTDSSCKHAKGLGEELIIGRPKYFKCDLYAWGE